MMRTYLTPDTIVRFLLNDNGEEASQLFEDAEAGALSLILDPLVVGDCCRMLEEVNVSRSNISNVLIRILLLDGIESPQKSTLLQALDNYGRESIDFTSAYLAAAAELSGAGISEV